MARKNDLAGLAALGALGMMLSQKGEKAPVEDRTDRSVSGDTRDYGVDYSEAPTRGRDFMTEAEPGWESGTAPSRRPSSGGRTPARPLRDDQYNPDVKQGRVRYAGEGGPRRGPAFEPNYGGPDEALMRRGTVTGNPGGSYDAPTRLTSAQAMRQLDEQTGVRQGPTAGDGRSVTGNETTRNLNNILNATAGLSIPGFIGGAASRATQAGNRAAKAADVAEKGREAVGNPLLWAQGPKAMAKEQKAIDAARKAADVEKKALSEADWTGGAIGNKKGGAIKKKMASGGSVKMSSASRRGDGIAQRGKTRGVMR